MTKPQHLYPKPAGLEPSEALKPRPGQEWITAETEREIAATKAATGDTFTRWRATLGAARAPRLIYDCWVKGKIVRRTLRRHLGSIWHTSEIPDYWITHDQWRELFDAAGYTHVRYGTSTSPGLFGSEVGESTARPTHPVVVYRGSILDRRDDWSWTANPTCAARWASGSVYNRPPGHVWVTTAPPENLLCRIDRWDQYVVDTTGLHITAFATEGDQS